MDEEHGPKGPTRGRSKDRPPKRKSSRSTSPRDRRHDTTRASRVVSDWALNPVNGCITHRHDCDPCRSYNDHFNDAALAEDRSFLRCLSKRTKLVEDKVFDRVEDARDEANRYRAEAMDARGEIARLEERCEELERQIKEHTCAPIATISMPGPSAQASRTKRVPPPPAPPAGGATDTPPGYHPGPFAATVARVTRPRPTRATVPSVAPPAAAVPTPPFPTVASSWPTLPASMGGQSTTPHPASLRFRKKAKTSDPYADRDSDDETERLFMGKDYKPRPKPAAPKVSATNLGNQIQSILRNRSVPGRGTVLLTPQTTQEWDHARRSLDDAHNAGHPQTGELLKALRRYITTANEVAAGDRASGSTNLSDVQRYALLQWRAPDWEQVSKWDHHSGTVVKTDTTKAEQRNRRNAGSIRAEQLRAALSDQLGLSTDGQPHPRLGDMASPRHQDHPDLWASHAQHMTKTAPRGFVFGPNGRPFQRHVRAFCRFAPLFRGSTGHMANYHGQIRVLSIIARNTYGDVLAAAGITPNARPDWSPIEFPPNGGHH